MSTSLLSALFSSHTITTITPSSAWFLRGFGAVLVRFWRGFGAFFFAVLDGRR